MQIEMLGNKAKNILNSGARGIHNTLSRFTSSTNPQVVSVKEAAFETFLGKCSKDVNLPVSCVSQAFQFFDEDMTIPFIARYRRDRVGNASPDALYDLKSRFDEYNKVVASREKKLKDLQSQGIDNMEVIESLLMSCSTIEELEEIYKPFKSDKPSAITLSLSFPGLGQVANRMLSDDEYQQWTVQNDFDSEKQMSSSQALINICIHEIVHDPTIKDICHSFLARSVTVDAHIKKTVSPEMRQSSKYRDYDNYNRRLATIHSNHLLAIRRGEHEKVLVVKKSVTDSCIEALTFKILEDYKIDRTRIGLAVNAKEAFAGFYAGLEKCIKPYSIQRNKFVGMAICEAVRKYLAPNAISELWKEALHRAEHDALKIFSENVSHLLMTPPLKEFYQVPAHSIDQAPASKRQKKSNNEHSSSSICADFKILGLDPGFAHGHKLAVIDYAGKIVLLDKIFPERNKSQALQSLSKIISDNNVTIIAIGDGVASFEAKKLCEEVVKSLGSSRQCAIANVSEAGASVYSASPAATSEFPGVDLTLLGAVSIARRLLNPLLELIKVDPKCLGVGMYQHDLSEKELEKQLTETLERCVAEVGIDIDECHVHLLKRLPGMTVSRAEAIVKAKDEQKIRSRQDLLSVKGVGPQTFRNIAGFIRVPNTTEPLDSTCIHPEQYEIAYKILREVGFLASPAAKLSSSDLGSVQLIEKIASFSAWSDVAENVSQPLPVIRDILAWLVSAPNKNLSTSLGSLALQSAPKELMKRGVPPSIEYVDNSIETSQKTKTEYTIGTILNGIVKNITSFGAFVDLRIPAAEVFSASTDEPRESSGKDSRKRQLESEQSTKKQNQYTCVGLLHRSQIQGQLQLGQSIRVKIENIDSERQRVGLVRAI